MSSDTWSEIQSLKNRQLSLREKLARRKKERQTQIETLTSDAPVPGSGGSVSTVAGSSPSQSTTSNLSTTTEAVSTSVSSPRLGGVSPGPEPQVTLSPDELYQLEHNLLVMLGDVTLVMPIEVDTLLTSVRKQMNKYISELAVEDLMHKFAAQKLITLESQKDKPKIQKPLLIVDSVDYNKLTAVLESFGEGDETRKRKKDSDDLLDSEKPPKIGRKVEKNENEDAIESLLSTDSAKQRESKKMTDEILQLLSKPTAKEQSLIERFKSVGGAQVKEFCPNGTREECKKVSLTGESCDKLHFIKIISKHTDESLGDCSFLNTCFHMDTCKFVHYEIEYPAEYQTKPKTQLLNKKIREGETVLFPPQWVQCDVRKFDLTVLGKFAVIMADPPWDIHMELPYGTMSDDEMRKLPIPAIQEDGYIFLWVTGRAMELGRECLQLWGYERVDELIWVKTNQLQRIIRTGRTGHWLNHGKEHCLVGMKGNLKNVNRGLDSDVIVAEVRATSHKPDEVYGIIERLSPGTRKIEIFGRPHNVQPNWVTLGNQLDGIKLSEPDIVKAYKKSYPKGYSM